MSNRTRLRVHSRLFRLSLKAQAAAQVLEDMNMTVNAYLIDVLTDPEVKGIMDKVVAAKLRGESVEYDEVRRRIGEMMHRHQ
jgi:hypothetical protein